MKIIKQKTHIDFVGRRGLAIVISTALLTLTLVLLLVRGLNLGVDFAGGTEIQLKFEQDVDPQVVRDAMAGLGFPSANVQVFGDREENEFLVRVERMSVLSETEHQQIVANLQQAAGEAVVVSPYDPDRGDTVDVTSTQAIEEGVLSQAVEQTGLQIDQIRGGQRGESFQYSVILEGVSTRLSEQLNEVVAGAVDLRRVEYVGPQVGRELRQKGYLSLLYACVFILIYLAIRFDFRFAPGAVAALAHDAFLVVGFYSLTGLEFNLTSIAAVLTIIGYSVNDTVVIYDRVRENLARFQGRDLGTVINQSINETLSRTIITSGTTVLALAGLWFIAQGTIWDFAVAMTFGIIVGTYSTIFVASPIVLWVDKLLAKSAAGKPAKSAA